MMNNLMCGNGAKIHTVNNLLSTFSQAGFFCQHTFIGDICEKKCQQRLVLSISQTVVTHRLQLKFVYS